MNFNKFPRISINFKSQSKAFTHQNFSKKNAAGFTLIEMMVTLSIMTLLTVMVLVYSRQSEKVTNLIRDSDKMVYELRRAQNLAMLTLQRSSSQAICGWGIYINKKTLPQTQYILFSDFCDTGTRRQYDEGETFETVKLLKGVEIFKSNVDSVVFVPPEPTIVFGSFEEDSDELDGNAHIRMRLTSQPKESYYKIRVTQSGQIFKILKE